MKTNEILDALISAGMKEEEVATWLQSRQSTTSGIIQSTLPVVYKNGTNFEVLPHLDLSRKAEVWGFEIIPGIVLAKKCGTDGNVESITRNNFKVFAEKHKLNGKSGSLPSQWVLRMNWSIELSHKIQAMDEFLCNNGVDAESRSAEDINYVGFPWCYESGDIDAEAYYFNLRKGYGSLNDMLIPDGCNRLAVTF